MPGSGVSQPPAAPPTGPAAGADSRTQLRIAVVALSLGVACVVVPTRIHPPAKATILAAEPPALHRIAIGGADRGTTRLSAMARRLTVTAAGDLTRGPVRTVLLTVPVPLEDCVRLARLHGAGCSEPAPTSLPDANVTVQASAAALRFTGAAAAGLTIDGSGAVELPSRQVAVRVDCGAPDASIVVMFDGSALPMRNACARRNPQIARLHFRLRYRTDPLYMLSGASSLDVRAPGRAADVRTDDATLTVGDRARTIAGADPSTIAIRADATQTFTVRSRGRSEHGSVAVAVPKAASAREDDGDEQVLNLLQKENGIWLGLAGVLVGIALTELVQWINTRRS